MQTEEKCKYVQMRTKQTVIQRNGIHMDIAADLVIDTSGTKTFTLVRIKIDSPMSGMGAVLFIL